MASVPAFAPGLDLANRATPLHAAGGALSTVRVMVNHGSLPSRRGVARLTMPADVQKSGPRARGRPPPEFCITYVHNSGRPPNSPSPPDFCMTRAP